MSWCATCAKIVLMGGAGAVAGVYLDQTYKLPNVSQSERLAAIVKVGRGLLVAYTDHTPACIPNAIKQALYFPFQVEANFKAIKEKLVKAAEKKK